VRLYSWKWRSTMMRWSSCCCCSFCMSAQDKLGAVTAA
jgi:hypothetical protein